MTGVVVDHVVMISLKLRDFAVNALLNIDKIQLGMTFWYLVSLGVNQIVLTIGEDYCPVIVTKMRECNPSSQPIAVH
nr:2081_t:CDS:2 [Entrophospora candida]